MGALTVQLDNDTGNPVDQTSTQIDNRTQAADVYLQGGLVAIDPATVVNTQYPASDGSSTITATTSPQNLFSGVVPQHGFAVYNSDATNDLWISETVTAVANGVGCIRIAANGGGYETPPGRKPMGVVSVVGVITGQKFTANKW